MASLAEIARKQALTQRLAESRARVGQKVVKVRHALDVPGRARSALRRNPTALLGASAVVGLFGSIWLRRKWRKRRAEAALIESFENSGQVIRKSRLSSGMGFLGGLLKTAAKAYVVEAITKAVLPAVGESKRPRW